MEFVSYSVGCSRTTLRNQLTIRKIFSGATQVRLAKNLFPDGAKVDFQIDEEARIFRLIESEYGKEVPASRIMTMGRKVHETVGTGRFNLVRRDDGWYCAY